ncbi:MAG: riboflavin synthase [Candidatus Fimivivens sp.]
MFTGLIAEKGWIKGIQRKRQMIQLTCEASKDLLSDYRIGDSMAVNGVCLTAIEKSDQLFTAEIMPETFKRTTFAYAKIGEVVNLERAMKAEQRFEGHIVSGHVDSVTRLVKKRADQNALILTFFYPPNHLGEIIPQGSIAINGVSLTVTQTHASHFSVSLIPHSKSITNLGNLAVGAPVNIETDVIAKYLKAQRDKGRCFQERGLL